MATIWMTYAWTDNSEGDVDFVSQELVRAGLTVKLDRWNIGAGRRLWEQIERFISDPTQSDAWVLYATQNSLGSEACKEEFAYALERAIHSRGNPFPVIGLFPSAVDSALIPAGLKTRLYVSITDPDWKERIKAAAEGRSPGIVAPNLDPYSLTIHAVTGQGASQFAVEVRPRAGTWSPFVAAIPAGERDRVNLHIQHGPRGVVPHGGVLFNSGTGSSDDGNWFFAFAQNEATPTQSYFIFCNELPSKLVFGVMNGQPQYLVNKP